MEAIPKLPMLTFEMKCSPDNFDLVPKLKRLIQTLYQEDPETFSKELGDISTLRSNACIQTSRDMNGISCLKKYYCQLHFLQNRFQIRGGSNDDIFTSHWYDLYSGALFTFSDIHCEMACVLYNIGCLHTILGNREDRSTSEGMKLACTHFQCAAWAFHTLPDKYRTETGSDMGADLLAFLSQVCLAQAQECILEKSILDHRKSSIIAKVGAQVADYFKQAYRKIYSSNAHNESVSGEEAIVDTVGSKLSKSWTRYCEFKMTYYSAISYFYMGMQSEENGKMGERITYYAKSSELLSACEKLAKKMDADIISKDLMANCLTFSSDVINGKVDISKRENEFVYHEKVPDLDSLPELKGASLVKGIGFEITNSDISGADIFSRLVPLEAHEASSLYSEEKAQLIREISATIAEKDEALNLFMSSLSLSEVPSPGDHISLPAELIEAAAGLSVQKENVVKKLVDAMSKIAGVASDVEMNLKQIKEMLEDEELQEKEYVAIVGKRPSPISQELIRECDKYQEAHQMASESNVTLHKAIRLHMENLKMLGKPLEELQKEIPSMADLDQTSEANIAEVHRILAKVEQMKQQRSLLMDQFRSEIHEDDITKKLVLYKDKDMDEVFKIELQKHDKTKRLLMLNLNAQDTILQALTECNAKYASTRRIVADLIHTRNEIISNLVVSYYAYEDLLHKADKGLEFYTKLGGNITKLLSRVRSVCQVQQEQRDVVLAKHHDLSTANMRLKPAEYPASYSSQDNSMMPDAPPMDSMDVQRPDALPLVASRPTLKDYLDMMKANNNNSARAPVNQAAATHVMVNPGSAQPPGTVIGTSVSDCRTMSTLANPGLSSVPASMSAIRNTYPALQNGSHFSITAPPPAGAAGPTYEGSRAITLTSPTVSNNVSPYQQQQPMPPQHMPTMRIANSSFVPYTTTYPGIAGGQGIPVRPAINYYSSASLASSVVSAPTTAAGYYITPTTTYSMPYFNPSLPNPATPSSVELSASSAALTTATLPHTSQIGPLVSAYPTPIRPISNLPSSYSTPATHSTSAADIRPTLAIQSHPAPFSQNGQTPPSAQLSQPAQLRNYPHPQTYTTSHMPTQTFVQQPTHPYSALQPQGAFQPGCQPDAQPSALYAGAGTAVQMMPHPPTTAYYAAPSTSASASAALTSTTTAAFMEPKLRAIVPQPGTVPRLAPVAPAQIMPVSTAYAPNCVTAMPGNGTKTSLEEMLGGTDGANGSNPESLLKPKVMTQSELAELKKEAQAREDIAKACAHDPYDQSRTQQQLLAEMDTLNNVIQDKEQFEAKWKEMLSLSDKLEPASKKRTVSVARCYPMKNRVPDVLPFDQTRVELPSTKDDYINASHVHQLTAHAPKFIAMQAPSSNTLTDFWIMVWQEQVETIVCLVPQVDYAYWPSERKEPLVVMNHLEVTLQSSKSCTQWTERIVTLLNKETNTSRVVVHLQLHHYQDKKAQLDSLLNLAETVLTYHRQQRVMSHSIVVHCLTGSGRTALFILTVACMAEINLGNQGDTSQTIVPDLVQLASELCQQRKGILKERDYLRQTYQIVIQYCKQILTKKGVLLPMAAATPGLVQSAAVPQLLALDLPAFGGLMHDSKEDLAGDAAACEAPAAAKCEASSSEQAAAAPAKLSPNFFTSELCRLADLSLLSAESAETGSPSRRKITKQDFINAEKNKHSALLKTTDSDPNDPLNQLDPLWSLK